MVTILIALDKYSDWLEVFSVLTDYPAGVVELHYLENSRNDKGSIEGVMKGMTNSKGWNFTTLFVGHTDKSILFDQFGCRAGQLKEGDILVAPFVRYRHFWRLVGIVKKGVTTVHLSECLPDTFGHIGYRLGFRGKKIKTWLTLPLAKLYAIKNRPDVCYFPLAPAFSNTFVKQTRQVTPPQLSSSKKKMLDLLMEEKVRTLLIGGFGYDVEKMAQALGISEYVATSKGMEIIIDGKSHPLEERICTEEVLLSGYVYRIAGYTSSAIVWARLLNPQIIIDCYKATEFDKQYGPYYSFFAKRALNKLGIQVKEENKSMLAI